MQRLRLSLLSQLAKQAHFVPAVSPLPGICQLAAPTLCAVTAVLPPTSSEARPVTNFISLRSFAAEPCRIEDPQSAAEALFKASDERAPSLYQPATFPFFARAYYVGTTQHVHVQGCGTCVVLQLTSQAAGNSINLSQLTKRAHKLGYHTYVGKGMVLICAAANTKGKLAEDGTVTVSIQMCNVANV